MPLRTLLLLAALLLLLPSTVQGQQIRLSGSLSEEGSVEIGMLNVMLEAAAPTMDMHELPAGDFEVTVESDGPVFVLVRTASRQLNPFWLEPGADVRIDESGEGETTRMRVTGPGSAGPALILTGGYEETWDERLEGTWAEIEAGSDEIEMTGYLDDAELVGKEMDALVRGAGLSDTYEEILLAENVARGNRMRGWALAYLSPTPEETSAIEARSREALMERSDLPGAAYAMRYIEAMGDELDDTYRETVTALNGTPSPSGFYHFRRAATSSPALKDALALEVMASMLSSEDYTREISELVEDFARTASSEPNRAFVEWMASQRQQIAPGQPAPALVAEHLDGGRTDLSDLRGRTVLITVWGSWCTWSRQELPHLERLRQRMAETDPDIVFLNLGWDQDGPWRDAVAEFGLGGENVLSTEEIRSAWTVTGTPNFIVIAPDGRIVTADAPRPSVDDGDALATVLRRASQ